MPDATNERSKAWTLRKGHRWRIGGVVVTPRETVTLEIDASVPVEMVKPDRQPTGDAA